MKWKSFIYLLCFVYPKDVRKTGHCTLVLSVTNRKKRINKRCCTCKIAKFQYLKKIYFYLYLKIDYMYVVATNFSFPCVSFLLRRKQ